MAALNDRLGPADAEAFLAWTPAQDGRLTDLFDNPRLRREPDGRVRLRVDTGRRHSNYSDHLHGGFVMALVDQALFGEVMLAGGGTPGTLVTLNAATSFVAPAHMGEPVDAVVETVGETGRMIFLRGQVEQGGRTVAQFQATLARRRPR